METLLLNTGALDASTATALAPETVPPPDVTTEIPIRPEALSAAGLTRIDRWRSGERSPYFC